MKRTSSMVYNETAESNELYLFTDNTQQLDGMIQAVKTSLEKKIVKGNFDADKAIDAFYHVTCEASNLYKKMFGYAFSVTDRFTAAQDLRDDFIAEVEARKQYIIH